MGAGNFDYFYEEESEQYSFYRIPKLLFTDPQFSSLSTDAKVLYGLMLDRMSLSRRNQWMDSFGRVYIVFTIEEVTEYLNCGKDKGVKILAELDDEKGIGLIKKHRQGFGKPTIIYVKNFASRLYAAKGMRVDLPPGMMSFDSEKPNSRSRKSRIQEVGKTEFMKAEKPNSRGRRSRIQGVGKIDANNNDSNDSDMSENHSINPSGKDVKEWREIIRDNISYECLCVDMDYHELQEVNELVEIMVEAIAIPRDYFYIGNMKYPYEYVKDRLLMIDMFAIKNLRLFLKDNKSNVKNMKAYLLMCLINITMTQTNAMASKVRYDMAQG